MTATNPWIHLFLTSENAIQIEPLAEIDAKHFFEKALKAIDSAKDEIAYGETVTELLLSHKNGLEEYHRSLATIGVWHFECAFELYEKAVRNFERAKERGLSRNEIKVAEIQISDCREQLKVVNIQKESAEVLLDSIST
jgi:hypothetical protein